MSIAIGFRLRSQGFEKQPSTEDRRQLSVLKFRSKRRSPSRLEVGANFAVAIDEGAPVRPFPPKTEIWVLLYCQVEQADGDSRRNLLLSHKQARLQVRKWTRGEGGAVGKDAAAVWSSNEVESALRMVGSARARR